MATIFKRILHKLTFMRIVLLGLVGLYIYVWAPWEPPATHYEVMVGDKKYRFPAEFVHNKSQLDGEVAVSRVVIGLLWPEMAAENDENSHYFNPLSPQKYINFIVHTGAYSLGLGAQGEVKKVFAGPAGLTSYDYDESGVYHLYEKDDYPQPKQGIFVVHCMRIGLVATGNEDHRRCRVNYQISKKTALYYEYFVPNLPNWKSIDQDIRAFVESMEIEPQ